MDIMKMYMYKYSSPTLYASINFKRKANAMRCLLTDGIMQSKSQFGTLRAI